MVKDLKYIIKRVLIGTLIALALMYFKGGLIGNVYAASVYPFNTTNNANFGSCTGCSTLNYDSPIGSSALSGKTGFLVFQVMNYSDSDQNSFIPTLTLVRVTMATGNRYACFINSSDHQYLQQSGGVNKQITTSSVVCPITFGSTGMINSIYIQTNGSGNGGISLYSPMSFYMTDDSEVVSSIQNVNSNLTSESDADTSDFLEDVQQDYSNNPVSDLITMPITFLQRLNNNINGSCTTWNLGSLLGTNLTMPCINLSDILGSTLYNLIDMAICLFLAYNLGLMCVTIWNNMTSLKDDFDDMYSPKHAYNGKHGGDS